MFWNGAISEWKRAQASTFLSVFRVYLLSFWRGLGAASFLHGGRGISQNVTELLPLLLLHPAVLKPDFHLRFV